MMSLSFLTFTLLVAVFSGWLMVRILLELFLIRFSKSDPSTMVAKIAKFINFNDEIDLLITKIAAPKNILSVKPLIEGHINTFINIRLQEKLPVIAMFASPDMLDKIKVGLLEEIDLLLPEVIENMSQRIKANFTPERIIAEAIAKIPTTKKKSIIRISLTAELVYLQLFGALSGFAIWLLLFVCLLINN